MYFLSDMEDPDSQTGGIFACEKEDGIVCGFPIDLNISNDSDSSFSEQRIYVVLYYGRT